MPNAQFRIDNATGLQLRSRAYTYNQTSGTQYDLLTLASGDGAIIDSIYVHSEEATTIFKLVLSIQDVSGGSSTTRRPFFVANMDPKETVLCASKSTPITIDEDTKIIMTTYTDTMATVNARVLISYREYEVA